MPLDKTYITSFLKRGSSNLRTADILGSEKFLRENNFEVESLLGCGRFGATMLAHNIANPSYQFLVAIKLIYVESEEDREICIEQL